MAALNVIMIIATVIALISLTIDLGGVPLSPSTERNLAILDWVIVSIFIAETFVRWGLQGFRFSYLKKHLLDFAIVSLFLLLIIAAIWYAPTLAHSKRWFPLFINLSIVRVYILITRFYIVGSPLMKAVGGMKRFTNVRLAPSQLIAFSFLFVILMGTGFLLLPEATVASERISFVDALFTATSATCVTGLIVVDTGSYFSRFGQIIILILIQIGGLGLMTITTFFALLLGRGMSIRDSVIMGEALNIKLISRIPSIIISALILTFIFEAIGAMFLWSTWVAFPKFEHGSVIYYSIFHSISAFCNAGFSLFNNSFEDFKGDFTLNMTITSLVIFGGLGFAVIMNLIRSKMLNQEKLTLHTKLVLTVTASLLAIGTLVILMAEWNNSLKDLPFSTKLMASYFQSVTPRTAGFNTLHIGKLTYACQFFMMIFMFIGASPGGTGGGIKTSTFGIVISSIWSKFIGRDNVEIFKRNIPRDTVNNAFVLIMLVLLILSIFGFILLLTQKVEPMSILFELFSAFGTVGLSTGITSKLTGLGKIVIILTMFIGRIGPLTSALALAQRHGKASYEYPDENVMVG